MFMPDHIKKRICDIVLIIPVTGGTSGTYTLVLDSANGYAEGDFERDPQ